MFQFDRLRFVQKYIFDLIECIVVSVCCFCEFSIDPRSYELYGRQIKCFCLCVHDMIEMCNCVAFMLIAICWLRAFISVVKSCFLLRAT
jgi:hypothetical protein